MTGRALYVYLSGVCASMYDDREASIIARYLVEDLYQEHFWSENEIPNFDSIALEKVVHRLLNHEPWQYIGGWADFYGYKFRVDNSVLIPRPETEELVYTALENIKNARLTSVLDIGTGSGIIPITIQKKSGLEQVFGLDISSSALKIAESNNQILDTKVHFFQFDILDRSQWHTLPKVDMIVSNPPYISLSEMNEMAPNVLDHEPHIALFVKKDTLEFYDAIAAFVQVFQDENCRVLVEINEKYGVEVVALFKKCGFKNIQLLSDLQGKDRIVMAHK
jgi:release factor glutamine methyltransferase